MNCKYVVAVWVIIIQWSSCGCHVSRWSRTHWHWFAEVSADVQWPKCYVWSVAFSTNSTGTWSLQRLWTSCTL